MSRSPFFFGDRMSGDLILLVGGQQRNIRRVDVMKDSYEKH
jgi:hypothetical protein